MNHHEKPTMQQAQAAVEVKAIFAEHLSQFKASCDAVHRIGNNCQQLQMRLSNPPCFRATRAKSFKLTTENNGSTTLICRKLVQFATGALLAKSNLQ